MKFSSSTSSPRSSVQRRSGKTNLERREALIRLSDGVKVKDRRYRLRLYKNCFVGSEAVDFMVDSGWAKSREEAVLIGQKLQKDFHLFCHVCGEHEFQDGYLFYRFILGGDGDDSTSVSTTDSGIYNPEGDVSESADPHLRQSNVDCIFKIGLLSIGEILRCDIRLYYKHSVNKECFTANEAIDFMITSGLASSREDAIRIGRALQREEFIESVDKGGPYQFRDARLFFSFAPDNETPDWEEQMETICKALSANIQVSDQIYHLKTYANTFTGSAAISKILELGFTTSRRDAVLLGRAIMHEYQLFEHVTRDHVLEDEEFFYKFSQQSVETTRIMETFRQRRKQYHSSDDEE